MHKTNDFNVGCLCSHYSFSCLKVVEKMIVSCKEVDQKSYEGCKEVDVGLLPFTSFP